MDQQPGAQDYIAVVLRWWWIVVAVVLISTIPVIIHSQSRPSQYEARTQLLMVSRTSEQIVNSTQTELSRRSSNEPVNTVTSSMASADTLSMLATANDLMAELNAEIKSENPEFSGMPIESLRGMIHTQVEVSQRVGPQTPLPILTTVVRGSDPELLQQIAAKWAELFIDRNAELFVTESARSFDFLQAQYSENREQIVAKGHQLVLYTQENPVASLEGLLAVQKKAFSNFLTDLETNRDELVSMNAKVKTIRDALNKEPPIISLKRTLPIDLVVRILGQALTEDSNIESWPEVSTIEEFQNPMHLKLREELSDIESKVKVLPVHVLYLETTTDELRKSIDKLSATVEEINLHRLLLQQDIELLNKMAIPLADRLQDARIAKEEQSSTIRLVETAIIPEVPVGPNRSRIVILAGVLSLVAGILATFVVHYLTYVVRWNPLRRI